MEIEEFCVKEEKKYPKDHDLELVEKLLTERVAEKFRLQPFPEAMSYLLPGPHRGGRVSQCWDIEPNVKITIASLCSKLSFILDDIEKDMDFRYYSIFKVMIHLFDTGRISIEYILYNDEKNLLTSGEIPLSAIDLDISTREKAAQLGNAIATKFLSSDAKEYKFKFHGFYEGCGITKRWFYRVVRAISTNGIKVKLTHHYSIVCRKL